MILYTSSVKRGRKPSIPKVKLTNRLLMQLECVRLQTRKTWDEMEDFFPVVCDYIFHNSSLKNELVRLSTVVKTSMDSINTEEFWSTDVEDFLDYKNIGPYLKEVRLLFFFLIS